MENCSGYFCIALVISILINPTTLAALTKPESYGAIQGNNENLLDLEIEHETVRQDGVVTPTPSPSPDASECSCASGVRVRKEVGSLTSAEWTSFARAFRALKDTNDGQSTFENFVRTHLRGVRDAHGTSQFGPWHREFLFQVECRLRRIDPSVTIPYWDWSIDSAAPHLSPVWNRIGGAVEGGAIPNAPFRGWSSAVATQHNVLRGFTAGQGGSFEERIENEETIRNLQTDASSNFADFSAALEDAHGTVHVGVGGDMGSTVTSPNDPIFYLHHAFVDKVWNEFQKLPGKSRLYDGTHRGAPVSLSDTTPAWSGTMRDFFDRDRCVVYEQPTRAGVPASSSLSVSGRSTTAALVQEAAQVATPEETKKLEGATEDRKAAVAKRIKKNAAIRKWALQNGFSKERMQKGLAVINKADPSIDSSEV
eukprot:Plantae.Rhodophyta-Hildenbrandia_rubra.ctg6670.p3 GENE.Plantae.Rhodophyta-Hildenbrandia_rubra.ctg6670~~Plantae.Rhodophyta-Hildenbrandia_rubra.ctg6670.p3  ORF type:complete len:424 (-),score=74.81 Plantae.Rhodophyta-Hildenbrandia_rubra.ctg6670:2665-3936(-)